MVAYFVVFGLAGSAAGGLTSLVSRQRWGWRAAAADWALAVAAALVIDFVMDFVIFLPSNFPNVWFNRFEMVVAATAVVARRLAPLVWRRKGTVGGKRPS